MMKKKSLTKTLRKPSEKYTSKAIVMKKKFESVFDAPKADLAPEVWKNIDGTYQLTDEAEKKIQKVVNWAINRFSIPSCTVFIVGSITSNQYDESSDVDVHFHSSKFKKDLAEQFNKKLKDAFEKEYKLNCKNDVNIGRHPIEVYMQADEYQDMMSVGCFNFTQKKWIVGPELADKSFDPYSQYYDDDMEYVQNVVDDIRSVILNVYELAVVMKKSTDQEFVLSKVQSLKTKLARAEKLFLAMKDSRKTLSAPTDMNDAAEKRVSKKWKIADSAFKLMHKFGYLAILKKYTDISKNFNVDNLKHILQDIVAAINDNLSNVNEVEAIDEGIRETLTFAAVCGLLAIPGIMPQSAVASAMQSIQRGQLKAQAKLVVPMQQLENAPQFQNAMKKAKDMAKGNSLIGKFDKVDSVNILAMVLYAEGSSEGDEGIHAIASVILNRSGKKIQKLIEVVLAEGQFSCWKEKNPWGLKKPNVDGKWKYMTPSNLSNQSAKDAWQECVRTATKLVEGKFTSTIGNMNCYLNKKTADKSAVDSWGKYCTKKIGRHHFGYQSCYDGAKRAQITGKVHKLADPDSSKYVVKKGDTLTKIATDHNIQLKSLIAKNPQIDPNKIRIGMELNI